MTDCATTSLLFSDLAVSNEDQRLIHVIAAKAARVLGVSVLTCEMDLMAVHAGGNPLRLRELVVSEGFEFAHDIGGIMNNIDRNSGKLMNCFDPRFTDYEALRQAGPSPEGA